MVLTYRQAGYTGRILNWTIYWYIGIKKYLATLKHSLCPIVFKNIER